VTPLLVFAEGAFRVTDVEEAHLAARGSIRVAQIDTPDRVREATRDAQALVVTTHPLTSAHIAALGDGVRVIGRAGTGLDAIDLDAARARGLFVYHTPDYATNEVATHALALILAVQRRILEADRVARTDFTGWSALKPIAPLQELVAGVVGGGRIGRAVMSRLLPLVARVVAFDPYVDAMPDGVERLGSLDELLRISNIVTLHMPLTPESRGMIRARELGLMPAGSIIVNVSRGGLIDQEELRAALEGGHLAGAALDVLTTEPPPPDDPILGAPRLLLSPHLGWYSSASERRVRTQLIDGVMALLMGDAPPTGRIAVDPRATEVR
jgi:D-3-phosphoglycerate dehydrogenase